MNMSVGVGLLMQLSLMSRRQLNGIRLFVGNHWNMMLLSAVEYQYICHSIIAVTKNSIPISKPPSGTVLPGGQLQDGDFLELHAEFNAYTPFLDIWQVAVGESVDVINTQNFEYVRNSHT